MCPPRKRRTVQLVFVIDLLVVDVGIDFGPTMARDFHAQPLKTGHPVKRCFIERSLEDERRKPADAEGRFIAGAKVKHLLASHLQGNRQGRQEPADPGPGRDDHPVSREPGRFGHDDRPAALQINPPDRGLFDHLQAITAVMAGQPDLQCQSARRGQHAGVRLEDHVVIVRQEERRVTLTPGPTRPPPVRNAQVGEIGRDLSHVIDAGRRERNATGAYVQSLAGIGLELSPGAKGFGHQPGVCRLRVGMPRDPGGTMRAATSVPEPELVDEYHPLAAPCEMIGGRRAHRSGADDHEPGVDRFHFEGPWDHRRGSARFSQ